MTIISRKSADIAARAAALGLTLHVNRDQVVASAPRPITQSSVAPVSSTRKVDDHAPYIDTSSAYANHCTDGRGILPSYVERGQGKTFAQSTSHSAPRPRSADHLSVVR